MAFSASQSLFAQILSARGMSSLKASRWNSALLTTNSDGRLRWISTDRRAGHVSRVEELVFDGADDFFEQLVLLRGVAVAGASISRQVVSLGAFCFDYLSVVWCAE